MVRVNFTADDLARTRFSAAPAPLVETGLVMMALRHAAIARRRGRARPWLREARRAFPSTARPLLDLLGPRAPWPDFIDSLAPDLEEGLDFVRSTPRSYLRAELEGCWADRPGRPPAWLRDLADGDREAVEVVVRALRDLHNAVVAPRWEGVLSSFHADVARRMPVLAAGGHKALFDSLHPELRWRNNGLERCGLDHEYDLNGAGLVLVPSAFWTCGPITMIGDGLRRSNALLYGVQPNGHQADPRGDPISEGAENGGNDSLGALVGPTRAAVLRTLEEPYGTADLASRVGISAASASEHAKVLRDAYLVETRREGRSVRHSLTPLGRTMLGHLPHLAQQPRERAG